MKEKQKINDAINALKKKYGEDVVVKADDNPIKIDIIKTGCYAIDNLLGCGGLPRGRLIEVFGETSSGKSTLCQFLVSQVQQQGGTCVYIDAEYAFDADYARSIGVNVKELIVSQPTTLEEAFGTVRAFVETNAVDLIVVDSVAALVPKKELEGEEMLKDSVAEQARLMNKALRILTGPISRSKTVVIFINQLREKIGIFYGNKDTTPGGKALKFYSSVRLKVSRGTKIEGKAGEQIGNTVEVTAVKNKVGFPWKSGSFDLYYGSGVDLISDTVAHGVTFGVIEKSGNTYVFDKKKLGVGKEQARVFLESNPDVYAEIRKLIAEKI